MMSEARQLRPRLDSAGLKSSKNMSRASSASPFLMSLDTCLESKLRCSVFIFENQPNFLSKTERGSQQDMGESMEGAAKRRAVTRTADWEREHGKVDNGRKQLPAT